MQLQGVNDCSCTDCFNACEAPIFPDPPEDFMVGIMYGEAFIMVIIFVVFTAVFVPLVVLYNMKHRLREGKKSSDINSEGRGSINY